MKIFTSIILSASLLTAACVLSSGGCSRTNYGPTLTEPAEVVETCFVPKGHGSDIAVGLNTGEGGGVTVTPINVKIPERYAVVFKCKHGKFVIDGDRGKLLYSKLDKGDRVEVSYCETYEVTKSKTNYVGLHFLDAKKAE